MYEGSSAKLFRKFALPQMIGLLFNSIYIIVDGLFIGNRLGRDAMAAAAVGVPLVEILIALSMAITSGAVTYIRYIITFSPFMLYSYLLAGIACYILILLFSRPFYSLFSPEDAELIDFAVNRSRAYFFGFFLAGFNILMISYWQSMENGGKALTISLLRSLILPPLLALTLPRIFGSEALWLCHSLSECLTAAAALMMMHRCAENR